MCGAKEIVINEQSSLKLINRSKNRLTDSWSVIARSSYCDLNACNLTFNLLSSAYTFSIVWLYPKLPLHFHNALSSERCYKQRTDPRTTLSLLFCQKKKNHFPSFYFNSLCILICALVAALASTDTPSLITSWTSWHRKITFIFTTNWSKFLPSKIGKYTWKLLLFESCHFSQIVHSFLRNNCWPNPAIDATLNS